MVLICSRQRHSVEMFPYTDVILDIFPHTGDIHNGVSGHVETVCLLSNRKSKPDTYIKLSLDMEDYYRIKDAEKEKNKTS